MAAMAVSGVRPLQDRHWPQQQPHRGPDACCDDCSSRASASMTGLLPQHGAGAQRAVWLARLPPAKATAATRPCCWAWPATSPTRWMSTPCPPCWPAIRKQGPSVPAGPARGGVRRKRDDLQYLRREGPALPCQRPALPGLRRRRRGTADSRCYYSVGGGFVVSEARSRPTAASTRPSRPTPRCCRCPFHSGEELLHRTQRAGGLDRAGDAAKRTAIGAADAEIDAGLLRDLAA
jgi:hypothetical protein